MELAVLAKRWFPHATEITDELLGEVIFLERRETEKLQVAVNNGIAMAFGDT